MKLKFVLISIRDQNRSKGQVTTIDNTSQAIEGFKKQKAPMK